MDFLKKNTSSDDDDIFELTDIIEKGPEEAPAPNGQNKAMETQMNNLFSKGNKNDQHIVPDDVDADLDALLAEMQGSSTTDSPTTAAQPSGAAHSSSPSLNVDEELEMPNMAEVDALLEGLDIPPQPEKTSSANPPVTNGDELDDLLNGLLDSPAAPSQSSPQVAATQSPASTAKAPDMNLDTSNDLGVLDDLDALFAASSSQAPEPAKASPPQETELNLDDLDALFAAEAPQSSEPEKVTPEPSAAPPPKAPAKSTQELSFDEELDALLGTPAAPAPMSATQPAAAVLPPEISAEVPAASNPNSPTADMLDDLDALFAANSSTAAKQTTPANSPVTSSAAPTNKPQFQSLEDDLDAILGSVDTSPISTPVPLDNIDSDSNDDDETPVDVSDLGTPELSTEDFLADIFDTEKDKTTNDTSTDDDLLAGLDVQDGLDGLPAPAQPADTDILEKLEALQSQDAAQEFPPTVLEAQDLALMSASNIADMPAMPASPPTDELDLPELDELDRLLGTSDTQENQPLAEEHSHALELEPEQSPSLSKDNSAIDDDISFEEEFSDADIARAAQELLDDKVREDASLSNVDTKAWLCSLDEILDADEAPPADSSTEADSEFTASLPGQGDPINLDNLLSRLPDSAESTHYIYSPVPQIPQNAMCTNCDVASSIPLAQRENTVLQSCFERGYTHELTRLQNITERFASSLADADARIATLSQNAKSEIALEAVFRADSPFSSNLQNAIRTAIATELRAHNTAESSASVSNQDQNIIALQAENTALQEKISTLEESLHSLQEQITPLEASLRDAQERISAQEDGNKEARLQTVETRLEGQTESAQALAEHCRVLETRLAEQAHSQAELEQRFQHEVEKAAAAAAARIIREEIAGILAGQ